MKIGFLIDDSLDRPDGVQQYVLGLGKQYSSQGHKVFYLSGETKNTEILNSYSLAKIIRVGFNGNVIGTPLPAKNRHIKAILSSLNLDVLHVQLPYSPFLAGRVIKAIGPQTAVVGTLHIYPNSNLENYLNKLLRLINQNTLKRFDNIIAVSNIAAQVSGLTKTSNILVIPNHVDLKKYSNAQTITTQEKNIVFLGRLVPRKGCQVLLESISLLKHQARLPKGVRVYIAGDGPLRSKLEKFVNANGLSKIVTFRGFLPESEKPSFLAQAEIAVFPSSGGESFGIVLLEAMASGAVVLAGNNPGYSEVMGSTSQLFNTSDVNELADKIENLLTSKSSRKTIKINQDKIVNKYDIGKVSISIENIYKQALRSRRAV